MLEIARALASRPNVLLLDEPASGLSTRETVELSSLLRRIVDEGITVLLVDHDMQFVMDIGHQHQRGLVRYLKAQHVLDDNRDGGNLDQGG